jgi:3-oxoacyl-[acyl-carrier-protein] synthase-3
VFHPRNQQVLDFIRRVKAGAQPRPRPPAPREARQPVAPFPPVRVREQFAIMPRVEALAVVKGEQACTNEDLIRNAAITWSPMTADDVQKKTGVETRLYTERDLELIALDAATRALAHAGRQPEEIGALIFCSCTSTRLIPSVATWLSGQLGMYQTHASVDLVAACAGLPYGMSEAVRILQEVNRPVLVVCAEKFSDKIGSVRTSRMLFGDGAAALLISPAPEGATPDIEVLQTYASGPMSEVASIIWPNPQFDNNITVYGPEVRRLAQRYLLQMIDELRTSPGIDEEDGSLLDSIALTVPHQANQTMVTELAGRAGLTADQLYFNIDRVGNVSAASIPIALYDAVRDGAIDRPTRVFVPGFGAGAVGGYAVMRFDPAIVAPETVRTDERQPEPAFPSGGGSSEDVRQAFGG